MNIETVKKYWNSRPCNIKHSNKLVGTKEYFDEVEQRKYFVEPHISSFVTFNDFNSNNISRNLRSCN